MALPMARCCMVKFIKSNFGYARNTTNASVLINSRCVSTENSVDKPVKDLEQLFIKPEVQTILKKITGFNLDKIFKPRQSLDRAAPKYKLLTDEQLKQYQDEAAERGEHRLQMPPVMRAWDSYDAEKAVLSTDSDIDDFDKHRRRYVFTDISDGLARKDRVVVVREPDGVLRLVEREVHDRVVQVYFPSPGKMHHMPKMFEESYLEKVLAEHRYEYVLDRACVQFEPNDPNYVRVTQRTYEHIATQKKFEDLRSTRHFGPMSFYFAFYQKIDQLLLDMIQRDLLSDAEDLVKLYHLLHPECLSAVEVSQQKLIGIPLIQSFAKHDALNGGVVEMALQSYEEAHQELQQSESS